jgi:hypothetical protein
MPSFSSRTAWPTGSNAIAQAVDARRAAGLPIIDLTETNPTRVGLPSVELALSPGGYAPDPFGWLSAREAVAAYHHGVVPPERICLVASTSEAYAWLFKLLCEPGDRVLAPTPSYPLFEHLAQLESVTLGHYSTRAWDDWSIDFDALAAAIDDRTRAILLVSPNNPTGAMLHSTDLPRLSALCQKHGLALISDEVFADYARPRTDRVASLAGFDQVLTFVLSGLSKVCLQPQLKVGWIATSGPAALGDEALRRLDLIADTFLSVNTPSQLALPGLLAKREEIQALLKARLSGNLDCLRRSVEGTSATLLRSDGGWNAVLKVPEARSEQQWVLDLLGEGVLVHPGFFFDFDGGAWLVVSLIVEERVFAEGVEKLVRLLA